MASLLPSMIIFDLDFVLWPFWIDTHVTPPFFGKGQKIIDSTGQRISCFPDVPRILDLLYRRGLRMAVAARIGDNKGANQLIDSFDWSKFFTFTVTHKGAVTNHIKQLHLLSGIPYSDMLYFNDEPRDLHQVERMGVLTFMVRQGLDLTTLRNAFDRYEKNKTRGPFSPDYKPRFRTFDNKPRRTFDKPRLSERDQFDRLYQPKSRAIDRRPFRRRSDVDRPYEPQKDTFDGPYEPEEDTFDGPSRPLSDTNDRSVNLQYVK